MRNQDGFTLVELMVALALTAIIATLSVAALQQTVRHMGLVTDQAMARQSALDTLHQMEIDLRGAIWSQDLPGTRFIGYPVIRNGYHQDVLTFTTLRLSSSSMADTETVIALYDVLQQTFRMRYARFPEDALLPKAEVIPAIESIQECRLRYFDGQRWLDQWDANSQRAVPAMIAIQLRVQGKGMTPMDYATTVQPSMQTTAEVS